MLSHFLKQLITFAVFFHSFTFDISHSLEFIWSKFCLLIRPISFLTGLMSLVVEWFKKFAWWSFKEIKQLAVSFPSILSSIFVSLTYLIPSQFILLDISLLDFLYVVATGDGILLFQAGTYLMFYQQRSLFFSMNALSLNLLNLRVTSFEKIISYFAEFNIFLRNFSRNFSEKKPYSCILCYMSVCFSCLTLFKTFLIALIAVFVSFTLNPCFKIN